MPKYRIVKVSNWRRLDTYRAEKKGWLFWHPVEVDVGIGHSSPAEYKSVSEAQNAIEIDKEYRSKPRRQILVKDA